METDPETMTVPVRRHDLDALEFDAVRELLLARLLTPLGRRAVEALRPLPDLASAERALARSSELAARLAEGEAVPVTGAGEVRSWLGAFFDGEHAPDSRDIATLKKLLRAVDRCGRWLRGGEPGGALASLADEFPDVADLVGELESLIDDQGEVVETASQKLAAIRAEIRAGEERVRGAMTRFLSDPGVRAFLQAGEPAWRHGRPVVQVRKEYRDRIQGVLHDRSQSGATLFVEPSVVVEAANALSDARAAEHREIQVIIARVCRGLRRCRAEVEAAVEAIGALDLLVACARLIHEDGFIAPEVGEDGPLRIRDGRHPILVAMADPTSVVPLHVTLGEPHHLLVVTGPNTGGKTVVLKTIGLLALMAMSGVPVPAAVGSRFPRFDGVFADIGDEQAISQNLSTFSSHTLRIARSLQAATPKSLVLLDELGAGTDPEEGGALGYAVLEMLERRGVAAVVTTHLGRLKEFAYRHKGAENGSMAFDGESLRPLYSLETGIPGSSHALDIAARVGVPAELVDRARALLGERDRTMEVAVQQVQDARRQAEADRRETARLARRAAERDEQLGERLEEADRRKLWLEEEADAVLDEQLRAAREAVMARCKVLRNAPAPWGKEARALEETLAQVLGNTSVHRRRMVFLGSLRRDQVVYVPRLGKRCLVKKVDRVREILTVEVGKMRMDIPFEDASWLQPL